MATYMAGTLKVSNMIWEGGREGQRVRGEHGGLQSIPPQPTGAVPSWRDGVSALRGRTRGSSHCAEKQVAHCMARPCGVKALHRTTRGALRCTENHVGQRTAGKREPSHRTENHAGLRIAWKKTPTIRGSTRRVANPGGSTCRTQAPGSTRRMRTRRRELCPSQSTKLHPTTSRRPLLAR